MISFRAMALADRVSELTEEELDGLLRAASWYASYFARDIAAEAEETHALAVEERRSYLALVRALRKLGVMFAVPDELREHAREAA